MIWFILPQMEWCVVHLYHCNHGKSFHCFCITFETNKSKILQYSPKFVEYDLFLLMLQKLGLAMVTHINKTGLDVLAYNLQFIN
jgi:hypothetical protein